MSVKVWGGGEESSRGGKGIRGRGPPPPGCFLQLQIPKGSKSFVLELQILQGLQTLFLDLQNLRDLAAGRLVSSFGPREWSRPTAWGERAITTLLTACYHSSN
jgi:hypothetical protein